MGIHLRLLRNLGGNCQILKVELEDIKTVWEASRFDWAISFAQLASQGDLKSLDQLNIWLDNWCEKNPPYFGLNWKCGQEASIRVIHLAIVAVILGQDKRPLPNLIELIKTHLLRIAPTIRYAIAQDNNHGTSEAAALFVGGAWLRIFVFLKQRNGQILDEFGWKIELSD